MLFGEEVSLVTNRCYEILLGKGTSFGSFHLLVDLVWRGGFLRKLSCSSKCCLESTLPSEANEF